MRRTLPILGAIAAITALACADGGAPVGPRPTDATLAPSQALAAERLQHYNAREPWSMLLNYTCSAPTEQVRLEGLMHTVSMEHRDGNGVRRWSFHSHPIQMRGVGLVSGREFKVVGAENTTREIHPDNYRHFRQVAILRLMTPGEPAWTLKVHVDRQGYPPAWEYRINSFEVECQ